jgi:hypothetical protein
MFFCAFRRNQIDALGGNLIATETSPFCGMRAYLSQDQYMPEYSAAEKAWNAEISGIRPERYCRAS